MMTATPLASKIMIVGGDGFCGWPTSLHLSKRGYEVLIVDDFSRRRIDNELKVESLTPIATLHTRLAAWKQYSGLTIEHLILDVCDNYDQLQNIIASYRPDAIVHFAQQKSAPYSMMSSWHKRYTVSRNTSSTTNILCALLDTGVDAHVVHLGTMGVYGYQTQDIPLPEGYLDVLIRNESGSLVEKKILHPFDPGSVYHMTKCLDSIQLYYFNKQDGVRVTDLHQGIVWGTHTAETVLSESLINRFDYYGDFGTVLNRFLIQAAIGYPLSVHGEGNQTRAFININDTVKCIELAIANPPVHASPVKILNQLTEIHRISDLARLVSKISGAKIESVSNPRTENENNALIAKNDGLLKLGLTPTSLSKGLLTELIDVAGKYASRIDRSKIPSNSTWSRTFK